MANFLEDLIWDDIAPASNAVVDFIGKNLGGKYYNPDAMREGSRMLMEDPRENILGAIKKIPQATAAAFDAPIGDAVLLAGPMGAAGQAAKLGGKEAVKQLLKLTGKGAAKLSAADIAVEAMQPPIQASPETAALTDELMKLESDKGSGKFPSAEEPQRKGRKITKEDIKSGNIKMTGDDYLADDVRGISRPQSHPDIINYFLPDQIRNKLLRQVGQHSGDPQKMQRQILSDISNPNKQAFVAQQLGIDPKMINSPQGPALVNKAIASYVNQASGGGTEQLFDVRSHMRDESSEEGRKQLKGLELINTAIAAKKAQVEASRGKDDRKDGFMSMAVDNLGKSATAVGAGALLEKLLPMLSGKLFQPRGSGAVVEKKGFELGGSSTDDIAGGLKKAFQSEQEFKKNLPAVVEKKLPTRASAAQTFDSKGLSVEEIRGLMKRLAQGENKITPSSVGGGPRPKSPKLSDEWGDLPDVLRRMLE